MEWHTVSRLSQHQDETAEGYLICRDVPIARTGTQIYWENEVPPLQGDVGGRVHVDREAAEVFHPDSVKSFEGKPLVDDHPWEPVGPDNWNDLVIGYVANARRGEGIHDDLLLADLIFTTRRGIDAVRSGKRAISVGYNAFYEQTAPGLGRQKSIFCNHVALVDEGRCGARCQIMDGRTVYNYDAEGFVESEHPRAPKGTAGGGEFTSGGGGGAAATHQQTKVVNGKRVTASGGDLPEHVAKLKIPPAWTNVTYSPDPGAALLATGRDAKGRRQAVYSDEHTARQSAEKFERIKALNAQFDKIRAANEKARKSPETAEAADAAALIMHTGMRPGGEAGATKADVQGYGATTLEGRHVVQTKDGVKLRFVPGKKHGQTIEMPISDPDIAKMLLKRKADAGNTGRLFDVNAAGLSKHVHSLGDFKTKDFRTHLGTKTAMDEVKRIPEPRDPKQYKRAVMMVAKSVSDKLGNTPTIALASYINPIVFAPWKESLGMTADATPDGDDDDWPDVFVGSVGNTPDPAGPPDDDDDDDEEPAEFPPDVAAILGFDPMDEDAGDDLDETDGDIHEGDDEDAGDTHDGTCACDQCRSAQETNTMSKRSLRDLLTSVGHAAFFAKDKLTIDKLIKDAEEEAGGEDPTAHAEPDGDEGKHASNVHVHIEHKGSAADTVDARLTKLEDSIARISDMLTTRASSKDADGDKDDDKKDDDKKTDDDDGDKDDDDDKKKDETKDVDAGEGAQTGIAPPSAEPDLMEADPALKMGPSMMGDSTYKSRINQAMNSLIRDTKGRAEVLSPGIKIGVLDGALGDDRMKQAGQRICDIRRQALTAAAGNERGMVAVGRHTADAIKTMSCDAVRMLFIDASDRMRQMNNAQNMPSPQFGDMRRRANGDLRSRIEDINKRNAEYWAAKGGTARRIG